VPFQDALTAEQMRRAFEAEGVSFGEAEDSADSNAHVGSNPQPVFTGGVTLWAMLSQALFTDVQRTAPGWPSLLQAGCEAQETSARTLIKIERSTPHRQLKVSWAYGPRLEASRATQRKRGLVLPPRLRFGLVSASTACGT